MPVKEMTLEELIAKQQEHKAKSAEGQGVLAPLTAGTLGITGGVKGVKADRVFWSYLHKHLTHQVAEAQTPLFTTSFL